MSVDGTVRFVQVAEARSNSWDASIEVWPGLCCGRWGPTPYPPYPAGPAAPAEQEATARTTIWRWYEQALLGFGTPGKQRGWDTGANVDTRIW